MHPEGVADVGADLEQDGLGERGLGEKGNCEKSKVGGARY
jgi:hypothetical protein